MRDIGIFMAGSVFTLLLVVASMVVAFKVEESREALEVRKERKKKQLAMKAAATTSAVVRPKTIQERKLEKDEEYQAFLDVINSP